VDLWEGYGELSFAKRLGGLVSFGGRGVWGYLPRKLKKAQAALPRQRGRRSLDLGLTNSF